MLQKSLVVQLCYILSAKDEKKEEKKHKKKKQKKKNTFIAKYCNDVLTVKLNA